jgi:Holliday junction resolvasome RuvABC endonuclease subunit
MRILSFDCSSTTIAYSVLQINKENNLIELKEVDFFKPIKTPDFILKLVDSRNKLKEIIEKTKPDLIAIEDIIKFFPGKSSANTIITLANFNRMLCVVAYDHLKVNPTMCSVMAIRHKLKESKELPSKQEMPELVAKHLKIKFPYKYKEKGKLKGQPLIENEDMADAIAVGLFTAINILNPKIKKQKKIKK